MTMDKPLVVLVSPALAESNNGNWQTAKRWQHLVRAHYRLEIVKQWQAGDSRPAAMLALHARRSAESIAAWSASFPGRGLGVVLTGTDLYRDIEFDPCAQRSLALAQQLVVLQDLGLGKVPMAYRDKSRVIYQSSQTRAALKKTRRHLRALMVGHLREEKLPQTLFEAAQRLDPAQGILIDHIGAGLDSALADQARHTMANCPHYRWLGALAHDKVLARIQRSHLLVHCSRMEGGAHVVMEAVCSGTPVLASDAPGNVGMLGLDYAGYFPTGDAAALVDLLCRCRQDMVAANSTLARLQAQCALRAPLFSPLAEQTALLALLDQLLST